MKAYFDYDISIFTYLPISGGVNYFFALSGFMMYYIYRESFDKPGQAKSFLLNRFIRIYPLYWILTCVFLLILFSFPGQFWEVDINIEAVLTSFLLLPNSSEAEPLLLVAWSLVHTVFFYIVFSLFFLVKRNISVPILAAWALLSVAFYQGYIGIDHYLIRFFFNLYNIIFLAGILCAYAVTHFKWNIKWSAAFVMIGLLGFPFTWINYLYHFVNLDFDLGTGLASVFIILGLASIDLQKEVRIPAFFHYLGNAAFSIYLSHNLILDVSIDLYSRLSIYNAAGGLITTVLVMALMTAAGCAVHSFVEEPLIAALKKRVFKKKTIVQKKLEEKEAGVHLS
ncbi:acyltransferase family protein [Domibacillus indicus]|uniref:acyltransferase family protein n=1 Tax=Domibacillus indicus TaxID=1437523 RepID=UPI001E481790|nr:acyltransferase [Domibacillus indicus]